MPAGNQFASYNMGDFDPQGHLWLASSASPLQWAEVDLVPTSPTYGRVIDSGTSTNPAGLTNGGADWSWIDGALYRVPATTTPVAHLVRFDPVTHAQADLGALVGVNDFGAVGATYTDGRYLYASANGTGNIYRIDPSTRTTILATAGPPSGNNDGARCASARIPTLTVKKAVAGRVQPGDQFTVALQDAQNAVLTSASTSGTATTASTTNWPVSQGATYTVTDAMAAGSPDALAAYAPSIACIDATTGAPVTTGGATAAWTIVIATDHDYTCTVTNTPAKPSYTVTKSASTTTVVPGATITYTVTVHNDGTVPYTAANPASFTDDLSTVLDDATYDNDATNGAAFSSPVLSWTGPLPVGGTVVVTYSVTVKSPNPGDDLLTNTVVPTGTGGACSPPAACTVTTKVASYTVAKSASRTSAAPGDVVGYAITLTNTGAVDFGVNNPAQFTDFLASVLDDATYNNDADNFATFSNITQTLVWTGAVPVGTSVTVTYSVTVNRPDLGDHVLSNTVVPSQPGGACQSATSCDSVVPVRSYDVTKASSASEVGLGGTITYTVTVHNTGQYAFTAGDPARFSDNLAGVLDDATYNNDADNGATYAAPIVSWAGALPVNGTVVVTYSVTVNTPDLGDKHLVNAITTPPDGPCVPGAAATTCGTDTPVRSFRVVKRADHTTAPPGQTITYTIAVTNTGAADYTVGSPASFTDDLSAVLDDAVYDNDAIASDGSTVSYAAPTLSWSGPLATGATVTITYTITVDNPDVGDTVLTNRITTPPDGNCAPGSTDPVCEVVVPTPRLQVTKVASASVADPGDAIQYTITIANTGAVAYTAADPASFTDDLTGVLDDALLGSVQATSGTFEFTGSSLVWSGPIAIGDSVTLVYGVVVRDPDTGDKLLRNVVTNPTGIGGSCQPGNTDPNCTSQVPVRSYTVTKQTSPATTTPGSVVHYTIMVTNTGQVDYTAATPASFTDNLAGVLDDATYNNDATNGAMFAAPTLVWSGPLAVGTSAVVTYSVTVNDPDTGNHVLDNSVAPGDPSGSCGQPSTCLTTTPVASYTTVKTASPATVTPGGTVTYTVTVTNTGAVAYTVANPASFTDDLSAVLDDATYNDDATSGATYTPPVVSWSGALPINGSVTVTYSVTVKDPNPGNDSLDNAVVTPPEGGCPPGTNDPACRTSSKVQSFTVAKTASAAVTTPGGVITYTVTVTNTGAVDYTVANPAAFTDDLSAVLDDATYDNDATNGATYTAPTLAWSAALPAGTTATVTYSVTVNAPDTGDHVLTNGLTTPPEGGCPDPTDPGCSTVTKVRSFAVLKTASTDTAVAGRQVTYTVTVTNTGAVDYTDAEPASFTDDLTPVLDDATYNNDATNGATFASPTVSWSGPVAVGGNTSVTFSVVVDAPDAGDHVLTNVVVTPPEGGCTSGATLPANCTTTTNIVSYAVAKVASSTAADPGDTVTYTVTVTNTGVVPFTLANPATFTDDLTGVLDDASYNDDATGGATYAAPTLSWSGPLAVDETKTFTYSVTVHDPDAGDASLANAVVTPPEGGCTPNAPAPSCATNTPVRSFTAVKSADHQTATPGDVITYTITVTNTGQADYTVADPASFTDDLSAVLDDATYNNDASSGATYAAPTLSWAGPLPIGGNAVIQYTVTVDNPPTGDRSLDNAVLTPPGGSCPNPTAPGCATTIKERSYEVVKSPSVDHADPGGTVSYTVTVTNTGALDYTVADPASFTDDLTAVLDDATYNDDATSGATYNAPVVSWAGPLPVGGFVTVTYSVTLADPDAGDHRLVNAVVTPVDGSCAPQVATASCGTITPVRSFSIVKSASATTAKAGDTVTYTIVVTNTGQADYTDAEPASLTDDLTDVLDDASYNDDGAATAGTVDFATPTLSWSGPLPVAGVAVVTYSATLHAPADGDRLMANVVTTPVGGDCESDSPNPACATSTKVQSFSVTKQANATEVNPGETVTYTVTVTNTGQADYTAGDPASFTDDLSDVLDDATYNDDASASDGSDAEYTAPVLSWAGPLAVGASTTVTYSITVGQPDAGDKVLRNAVITTPDGGCTPDSADPACTSTVPSPILQITKVASTATAAPGQIVTYTITAKNTGLGDFTAARPATFTDDLSGVLDDATYNNDATDGATYAAPTLTWTSPLAAGATATITYSVTVDTPDTGDKVLANAVVTPTDINGNCAASISSETVSSESCRTSTPVASYSVTKRASASSAHPGDRVTYTVDVRNTGQAAFTDADPATFVDDLSAVLDDATYNGDATGGATFASPLLTWSGALAIGETRSITYSVTVDADSRGDGQLDNVVTTPTSGTVDPSTCPASNLSAGCRTHTAVAATEQERNLPHTGSDIRPFLEVAMALLAAGAFLLGLTRRRRRSA